MAKIFVTSDLHFCHDREFIYKPRGFETVDEMNITILQNWNEYVRPKDTVYVLGDLMLGGPKSTEGLDYISQLNGNLHLVLGNHDTDRRKQLYSELKNVISIDYATMLHYKGYHFYMSHYPTLTANLEKESLKQCTINLFGHTHQTTKFFNDMPFMYHVGVDAHNCTPVEIDDIIKDMKEKVKECLNVL